MLREIPYNATNGLGVQLLGLALQPARIARGQSAVRVENAIQAVAWIVVFVLVAITLGGLLTISPNEAKVLTLFGKYVGTVREAGLWWANPFYAKRRAS